MPHTVWQTLLTQFTNINSFRSPAFSYESQGYIEKVVIYSRSHRQQWGTQISMQVV